MKRAYVTGGTGCVGRNIVNELLLEDWEVVVLYRTSSDISRLAGLRVKFQEVNLHDLESVRKSISGSVDAIFHAAGNTSHWSAEIEQQWKDNVLATRNLVKIALEKNVKRFIFTSTNATQDFQGYDAQFSQRIASPYVRTKRLAELEVYAASERGLDIVILRPIIVIGAYDYNSYAQIFTNVAKTKLPFAFPGRIVFCHAGDVAKAHVQAFEKGRRCEHYVLGGTYSTWLDVFQRIARMMSVKSKVRTAPYWALLAVSHILNFIAKLTTKKPVITPELVHLLHDAPDVSYYEKQKAKQDLGYTSRSLDVMLHDCYKWLIKEKKLEKKVLNGEGL